METALHRDGSWTGRNFYMRPTDPYRPFGHMHMRAGGICKLACKLRQKRLTADIFIHLQYCCTLGQGGPGMQMPHIMSSWPPAFILLVYMLSHMFIDLSIGCKIILYIKSISIFTIVSVFGLTHLTMVYICRGSVLLSALSALSHVTHDHLECHDVVMITT